jgi:hypothetical protein
MVTIVFPCMYVQYVCMYSMCVFISQPRHGSDGLSLTGSSLIVVLVLTFVRVRMRV